MCNFFSRFRAHDTDEVIPHLERLARVGLDPTSAQQDPRDVGAVLGVDYSKTNAPQGPDTKFPNRDVSAVYRVIQAASSVALY
jgi:hypothetical protein